jgi:4-hydroxybenzoate polyprenyltransferase
MTTTIAMPMSPVGKFRTFAADIKISHTLFALPWALLAMFLAAGGMPRPIIIFLILGCMVFARTFAMAANRLFDAKLDEINPRTARRAIPAGKLSREFYRIILTACGLAFLACASGFRIFANNPWPILLALPVLAYLSAYPFLKRFTRLCHYYLGGALALAPLCAFLAVRGSINLAPILMFATVFTWTAGFDIIYACQDYESDRATGVFSVPAKIGIGSALWVARCTHLFSIAFLILLGLTTSAFGVLYFIGVGCAILLLIIEHSLVHPDDLSKVNLAFFTINGIISVAVCTLGIIDIFL